MKIRVISDLHTDVNQDYRYILNWRNKDILTIIDGYVANNLGYTAAFL
jgi:hypothetical protein